MSLESDSNLTRLEQIKKKVKEYKALVKHWERLETDEVILLNNRKVDDLNEKPLTLKEREDFNHKILKVVGRLSCE